MRNTRLLHDCIGRHPGGAIGRYSDRQSTVSPSLVRAFLSQTQKTVLLEHGHDLVVKPIHAAKNSPLQAAMGLFFGGCFSCASKSMSTQP